MGHPVYIIFNLFIIVLVTKINF